MRLRERIRLAPDQTGLHVLLEKFDFIMDSATSSKNSRDIKYRDKVN